MSNWFKGDWTKFTRPTFSCSEAPGDVDVLQSPEMWPLQSQGNSLAAQPSISLSQYKHTTTTTNTTHTQTHFKSGQLIHYSHSCSAKTESSLDSKPSCRPKSAILSVHVARKKTTSYAGQWQTVHVDMSQHNPVSDLNKLWSPWRKLACTCGDPGGHAHDLCMT